ncbi:MAG: peptidylprolyl isomerase [Isosphaeraceae bacterium]
MRSIARFGGLLALWATLASATPSFAQATRPAAPAAATSPAKPPENFNQVLATVNGESITRGELVNFLSRYQIPQGNEEQAYRDAIETLVNTHLINQFLIRQRINVPEEKINEAVASLEKQLKQDGSDLASELIRSNMSMADVRKDYANRLRWLEYVNTKATDAELKRFESSHKDLFSGTQVKASHILVKVEPNASAADKEKARQKLLGIKKEIDEKKVTFAEAANKHSEDPANADGAGGDVGYFGLNSGFIEEFANAAFALPKGAVSSIVETPYGLHLITVTDRKEGSPFDFEQNKPFVKQMYAADLQKSILSAARKTAMLETKPMPADLFAPASPPSTTPAPAPAGSTRPAETKK